MYSLIKKFHKNNKGDTLAIVLIGMTVVFVLGAVVLKASSVNYGMKVSNFKSKQNFYYVEMAVDDVYAGLGDEVSKAIEDAYTKTVTNIVDPSSLDKSTSALLQSNFVTNYVSYLAPSVSLSTKPCYASMDSDSGRSTLIAHLQTFIDNATKYSGLDVTVTLSASNDSDSSKRTIVEHTTDASGNVEKITIKNIKITSVTNTGKYTSSVTTDFVISVPNITFDFKDTTQDDDLNEFYKYAIIADGEPSTQGGDYNKNKVQAAVSVSRGGSVVVNGNIYAGEYKGKDVNNNDIDKEGIEVSENSSLTVNGANVISKGDIVANSNSQITLNGENTTDNKYTTNPDTLRLWAKNLEIVGNSASLTVNGDSFIKDDLEVNANNDTVSLKGSYYGFGFEGTVSGDMVNEDDSNSNTGFNDTATDEKDTDTEYEHERRSAVIVNGDEADVTLTGGDNPTLLLGGRAYIDLTGGKTDGVGATYMTGESISIKGNQSIYLLDNVSSKQGEGATIALSGNPTPFDSSWSSLTYNQFYAGCNFTEDVVCKKVNGNVYFYHSSDEADSQTEYVVNGIKAGLLSSTLETLQKVASSQKNIAFGDGTTVYSVGTAIEVKDGKLQADASNVPNAGIDDADEFSSLVSDADARYSHMMYDLKDDRTSTVGNSSLDKSDVDSSKSPYDYYIRHEDFLDGGNTNGISVGAEQTLRYSDTTGRSGALKPGSITFPTSAYEATEIDRDELSEIITEPGNWEVVVKVGNNVENGEIYTNTNDTNGKTMQYGVIICTGDVHVNCNFTGMIICGGDIIIDSGYTFNASPKLMKVLRNHNDYLKALISTGVAPTISIDDTTQLIGGDSSFTFDNFLSIENWRKNAD